MSIRSGATRRYTPLFQRVAATNAIVLVSACVVTILVVSPHKLSSFAADEAVVLLAALIVVVAINLYLLRRALAPLEALTAVARTRGSDPARAARAGERADVGGRRAGGDVQRDARAPGARAAGLAPGACSPPGVASGCASPRSCTTRSARRLTAVLLQLGRVAKRAGRELADELRGGPGDGRASLEDVRRIALELRPEALDDLGLRERAGGAQRALRASAAGCAVDAHLDRDAAGARRARPSSSSTASRRRR